VQPLAPERSRIGWIGLGRMGAPMARRVMAAGWAVTLWARHPERAPLDFAEPDRMWAKSLTQLADTCDGIVTVVSGPDDVRELHEALMPIARKGTVFIDVSTALPSTAQGSASAAEAHDHLSIDCPVTGGVAGAQRGSLTGFAGGSASAVAVADPVLRAFCQRVVPCGPAGSGYRTKLINQTLMAGVLMGLADGARLARACGLDATWLKTSLASGTGSSVLFDTYLERMMTADGAVTFTLGLLLKDLQLAHSVCAELQLQAPLLDAAMTAARAAIETHGADAGIQTLAR
jgi:3-hydroxyisobutyrate dehydrogenase-like beta-hydroxyacid dehydrogenase